MEMYKMINRREFIRKSSLGILGLLFLPTLKKLDFILPDIEPIVEPISHNRYWVGGSGNWSDINHWATTRDGIGGASLPDATCDVYLEVPDGDILTVDVSGYCRNLTYTGELPDRTAEEWQKAFADIRLLVSVQI
jgi:hypothetical protein